MPETLLSPNDVLSPEEVLRYGRHLTLPGFGLEAQHRLKAASALIVGAGGLGSPVAMYLAAAGVGRIGLVDFDAVDASNLQRQVLHGTSDIGRPKLASARDRLRDLNPHVDLELHALRLTSENALALIDGYDVVADGTDNFPTRYLVNDACVLTGTPNVYASIFRFEGQASVFGMPGGPCYRCLFEKPPPPGLVPSCAEGGVLGVLPGLLGTIQATEVVKVVCGIGEPLVGRLLLVDALAMTFRTLHLDRNPDCPVCGDAPTQTGLIDYDAFCGLPAAGADAVPELSVEALKRRLDAGERLVLLDVRNPNERAVADLGGYFIPLGQLDERLDELHAHRSEPIVVYCKSGQRSARAGAQLRAAGFGDASSLAGGLDAWRARIDPTLPVV